MYLGAWLLYMGYSILSNCLCTHFVFAYSGIMFKQIIICCFDGKPIK